MPPCSEYKLAGGGHALSVGSTPRPQVGLLDRSSEKRRMTLQLESARKQLAATWGERQPEMGEHRRGEAKVGMKPHWVLAPIPV